MAEGRWSRLTAAQSSDGVVETSVDERADGSGDDNVVTADGTRLGRP